MEIEVESSIGWPSASVPARPRDGRVSHDGEEAVAPRVHPVLAKPTEAEQYEHYATGHAMQPTGRGVSTSMCVTTRECF